MCGNMSRHYERKRKFVQFLCFSSIVLSFCAEAHSLFAGANNVPSDELKFRIESLEVPGKTQMKRIARFEDSY